MLGTVAESGVDPTLLQLEITESTVMDNPDYAIETLTSVRAKGIQVAMDDFGTGHSSLGMINQLPLDVIKFDRSLITGIEHDQKCRTLFTRLVEMTHELGLLSVAEGVETEGQIKLCQDLNCNLIQGYAFYRPMGLSELNTTLEANSDGNLH